MQGQRTIWRYVAGAAVLASCGVGCSVGGNADKKEAPKPLPADIVKAWREAGASVGWVKIITDGEWSFYPQENGVVAGAGAIPTFCFSSEKEFVRANLPDPGAAFALDLFSAKVTDVGLKELARLPRRRA